MAIDDTSVVPENIAYGKSYCDALGVTDDELMRIAARIRPFPLPSEAVPVKTSQFQDLSREMILNAPAHLMVHLQRTAAQGGMQVISPRQTPLTSMMNRKCQEKRLLGDHVVGSIAEPLEEWPTMDDMDFSQLLPDEPLPPSDVEVTHRTRTKTVSITSATGMLSDPILACLIKGRAVIDILNRHDVQGDGAGVATLLADAWGLKEGDIMDLDGFSLGYDGPLLRHAIKSDEVYPTIYAPVHQRKSISVGSNEVSKKNLAEDTALDWRRMRVFCEAVFSMATSIEGYPLKAMRAIPPPGDMTAPGNRPNVMVFIPAPCTAWVHCPSTFAVNPVLERRVSKSRAIPEEVAMALARYVSVVKPMTHAMKVGHKATTQVTHLQPVEFAESETIQSTYAHVISRMATTGARGRTPAKTLRNFIYETICAADMGFAARINQYIQLAKSEVKVHLGTTDVPDRLIDKLADSFLGIGKAIRLKITAEATMRGHTVEDWWDDVTAQCTPRYKNMAESSRGWALVGMYLIFKSPTPKWTALASAVNYATIRDLARRAVGSVGLPAEVGSAERLLHAARHVARSVSRVYAEQYAGVGDVGMALADVLKEQGKERSSEALREGAILWHLRGRVFRAVNVELLGKGKLAKSANHYIAHGDPISINLAPAPYTPYKAYMVHLAKSEYVPDSVKNLFPEVIASKISSVFQKIKRPIMPCKQSRVTKYLACPADLGNDMEKAWSELVWDMEWVLAEYGAKKPDPIPMIVPVEQTVVIEEIHLEIPRHVPSTDGKKDYFEIMARAGIEAADYIDDLLEELDEATSDMIMEGTYRTVDEILMTIQGFKKQVDDMRGKNNETVR
jgi:hypothetical protein